MTIPLTKGLACMVDDEDFEILSQYRWITLKGKHTHYAHRMIQPDGTKASRTSTLMHRQILNVLKGMVVDHIDGNGLNNTRANMRICTYSENLGYQRTLRKNKTSRFKGVSWNTQNEHWVSNIQVNKKYMHIGAFDDETEAAKAYDAMSMRHFKEFAYTNFKY